MTTSRDDVLHGLVQRGVLTAEQATAVSTALTEADAAESGPPRWLAEAAGYVGGVLMLGGALILLATQWETMTKSGRATSLGLVTLALLIAAGLIGALGERSPVRRRIASVLTALASGTAAGTAGVIVEHQSATAAGLTGLAVAIIGYAILRGIPLLLAAGVFTIIAGFAIPEDFRRSTDDWQTTQMFQTFLVLGLGAVWILLSLTPIIRPAPVGFGIGATVAYTGAQVGLAGNNSWWGYTLTFVIAVVCFLLYRIRRTLILLIAGVVGVALAAPEAVWDWTNGAAGGAVILLVAGAALLAGSMIGLGLRRQTAEPAAPEQPK